MANVSAPYNFVPLNEKVFFPPWANLVNHDVPFKDGLSGQIELEITAETPIFIRGKEEINDEDARYKQYRFPEKGDRYYIPGSSIRNMLRSVVEIMSFSKLSIINNYKKIGFRDMANNNLYNLRNNIAQSLYYGWLFKDGNNNIHIEKNGLVGNLRNDLNNTVDIYRDDRFSQIRSNYTRNLQGNHIPSLEKKYKDYIANNNDSAINYSQNAEDIVVLTGYISGKTHEFLFQKPSFQPDYNISPEKFNLFLLGNPILKEENLWGFWKDKFESNIPVPIFFRLDNNGIILDFGLTVLYKMTHKNSVIDLLKLSQSQPKYNDERKDLVETIFGTIDDEKLKGRVQVGHAFSNNASEYTKQNLVLGEPNHSFYPNYIKQNVDDDGLLQPNNFKTLSNDDAEISGRKRYPIHHKFNPSDINQEEPDNQKVITSFYPLKSESKFNTIINYHNLLPVELGALLSAITFHNSNDYRHNIGLAKPYGFGKIKMEISGINNEKKYMSLYENVMTNFLNNYSINWLKSDQLKELFAMASVNVNQDRNKLKYMKIKEFQEIKKINKESKRDASIRLGIQNPRNNDLLIINKKQGLPLYSKFMQINEFSIKSLITEPIKDNSLNIYSKLNLNDKFEFLNKRNEKLNSLLQKINDKIQQERKNTTEILKKQDDLINLSFDEIQVNQEFKTIITSIKPNKAKIKIDDNFEEIQLIIPKGNNLNNFKIGQIINVTIHQISTKKNKIVSLKYKNQ